MRATLALGTVLLLLLLAGSVPMLQESLLLERNSVFRGQVWRLLSGHFVHVSRLHMLANLAGVSLLLAWAWQAHRMKEVLVFLLAGSPILGTILLAGGSNWYAGLSGMLHGAAVLLLFTLPGKLRLTGFAILLAKLIWQQWFMPSAYLPGAQVPIALAAHWWGSALGLAFHQYLQFVRSHRNRGHPQLF